MTRKKNVTQPKKRSFSGFDLDSALKELSLKKLQKWVVEFTPLPPDDFFHECLSRLENFDLRRSEPAKELLIDVCLQELIPRHRQLKVWKEMPFASDTLAGVADYLLTENIDYVEAPLLCVVEAKKDDFEQGLAQCLVAMKAARWNNEQVGKTIDIYGVVSNGWGWEFYRYTTDGQVWGSPEYALADTPAVLGALDYILTECEKNL